jgi:hypothetical protein
MELSYQKNDNSKLFNSLVKSELINVSNIQNYIPIYSKFFALTNTNYNSINLKQNYSLYNITSKHSENIFQGKVKDAYGNTHTKDIFFKYSPLIDPVKYMIGKYDNSNNILFNLPTFINNNSHEKMRDTNNTAYIDSFFSYLSSQLLHHHGFIHGLDFYGSFISIKNDFMVNVCDDMEYLTVSPFFKKNLGQLFTIDCDFQMNYNSSDTRTYKEPIKIMNEKENLSIQLADIHDLDELDKLLVESTSNKTDNNDELDIIYENNDINRQSNTLSSSNSGSTCSSRSSNTNESENENENESESDENRENKLNKEEQNNDEKEENDNKKDNEKEENDNEKEENDDEEDNVSEQNSKLDSELDSECDSAYSSSCEEDEDDTVIATIKTFPVQLIALEKCEDTLDSLITNNDLSDDEWGSIVIQILMSLITFQKTFQLTHNDLHTNNVMYIKTDISHLYYKVNNKHYKVPTFGRIFKIIDFGRAIYKFRKTTICSDSFNRNGDASTQYNCEPYLNSKKPRVDPNSSFDLCRLGCSLFDMIVDDLKCIDSVTSPILKIIINWCMDDKKRNVLYKNNGEERYPDFKLYKMIARTVHNHVPLNVLQNEYFHQYVIEKKKIKKNALSIMDIDEMPCYV